MQNPALKRGSLAHATALKFLRDVVDIAFPRLVSNGYYHPDTDTSGWPEGIYRQYYYDRDAKDLQKVSVCCCCRHSCCCPSVRPTFVLLASSASWPCCIVFYALKYCRAARGPAMARHVLSTWSGAM